MIIDDNFTSRCVLEQMLLHWHTRPVAVESGEKAVDMLLNGNQDFEYLLLDAQMPGMDGVGVAQFIKKTPSLYAKKITIIMMLSSTAQRGIIEQHEILNIRVYLNKPIVQGELLDALMKPYKKEVSHHPPSQQPVVIPVIPIKTDVKLLLVEDNVVNQKLAIRLLQKLGYNAKVAVNGKVAIEAVEKETFDLILMDVQMPEMGGFEATAGIRDFEAKATPGRRTPIIAMTAHAIQGYREKCLEGGMDGYISKPIRVEALKKAIEDALQHKDKGSDPKSETNETSETKRHINFNLEPQEINTKKKKEN